MIDQRLRIVLVAADKRYALGGKGVLGISKQRILRNGISGKEYIFKNTDEFVPIQHFSAFRLPPHLAFLHLLLNQSMPSLLASSTSPLFLVGQSPGIIPVDQDRHSSSIPTTVSRPFWTSSSLLHPSTTVNLHIDTRDELAVVTRCKKIPLAYWSSTQTTFTKDPAPPAQDFNPSTAGVSLRLTKEQCCLGNIGRIRQPAQRHIAQEILDIFWRERDADKGLKQACSAKQRQQTVDADLLRAVFGREALCCLSPGDKVSNEA